MKKTDSAITMQQLAALIGVTEGAFKNRYRPLIPERYIHKTGRRITFTRGAVGALIDALISLERERLADADEAAISGPPSEALERLRTAKAQHAELDLAERRGELVPRDTTDKILSIAASHIRNALVRLQRKGHIECAQTVNDALDEAEAIMERALR